MAAGNGATADRVKTRLIFELDSLNQLGELANEILQAERASSRNVLLVTDAGLMEARHGPRAERILREAGLCVSLYNAVRENPTTDDVARCVRAAQEARADLIVGLGGGSSIDTAKGCNFILTNGGRMQDYWGYGKAARPLPPMIIVPTASGTGSELQSYALIADEETHQKMACGDPKALPRIALLDPALTLSQPPPVTVATGLDAIAHALESAGSRRRNPVSRKYSFTAFRYCARSFPRVLAAPRDREARGRMLLGAAHAGGAIENSMLGAAHALANPLTARFGVTHGSAAAMMPPHVIRYNAANAAARGLYRELAIDAGLVAPSAAAEPAVAAIANCITAGLAAAEGANTLAGWGVAAKDAPQLAELAATQWTAQFNPRPINEKEMTELYGSSDSGVG